jgi:hypothetical protein
MYAPHEHVQHHCQRVLAVACPGSLRVADIKGDVGATRVLETGMAQKTVAEVANKAARGEHPAVQAIKMIKQAATKAGRTY